MTNKWLVAIVAAAAACSYCCWGCAVVDAVACNCCFQEQTHKYLQIDLGGARKKPTRKGNGKTTKGATTLFIKPFVSKCIRFKKQFHKTRTYKCILFQSFNVVVCIYTILLKNKILTLSS